MSKKEKEDKRDYFVYQIPIIEYKDFYGIPTLLIDIKHELASKEDLHHLLEKRSSENYEDLEEREYYVEGLDKVFIAEKITKITDKNTILEIKKKTSREEIIKKWEEYLEKFDKGETVFQVKGYFKNNKKIPSYLYPATALRPVIKLENIKENFQLEPYERNKKILKIKKQLKENLEKYNILLSEKFISEKEINIIIKDKKIIKNLDYNPVIRDAEERPFTVKNNIKNFIKSEFKPFIVKNELNLMPIYFGSKENIESAEPSREFIKKIREKLELFGFKLKNVEYPDKDKSKKIL